MNIYFQTDVDDFVMTWGHRTAKYFSQIEKQLTPYIERYILMDILIEKQLTPYIERYILMDILIKKQLTPYIEKYILMDILMNYTVM